MRFWLLFILLLLSCSGDRFAGGTTSVGNGMVSATIVYDGDPVRTTVLLVPTSFDPQIDDTVYIKRKVSSDCGGVFFDSVSPGEYTVVVVDTIEGYGAVSEPISTTVDSSVNVEISLQKLSSVAYYFPDTLAVEWVSLAIQGTPIYYRSDSFQEYEQGMKQVLFSHIPAGDYLLSTIETDKALMVRSDTLLVQGNDTTLISFDNSAVDTLRPLWTFPLIVGVPADLVSEYGGLEEVQNLVTAHVAKAEECFLGEEFKGIFSFPVDSIYEIAGTLVDNIVPPPTGFAYRLLYSPYEKSSYGGWNETNRVLIQDHGAHEVGGVWGETSLLGLRWAMGMARGALYIEYEKVTPTDDTLSGEGYTPPPSIMTLQSKSIWNPVNIALLNRNTNALDNSVYTRYLQNCDSITIVLKDSAGAPIPTASIELWGVNYYYNGFSSEAVATVTTDINGRVTLHMNPYLNSSGTKLQYTNFILAISSGEEHRYSWLPYSEVAYALLNKENKHFYIEIDM